MIDVRLSVASPSGAFRADLPEASNMSVMWADPSGGSLTFDLPLSAAGAAYVNDAAGAEIIVEVFNDGFGSWVEPANSRFVVVGLDTDEANPSVVKVTGATLDWLLTRSVWQAGSSSEPKAGERAFTSATAGQIMRAAFDEATSRGTLSSYSLTSSSFTSKVDSAGRPWSKVLSVSYQVGMPTWATLENLIGQGMVLRTWRGHELQLVDGSAADTKPVISATLFVGRDVTEAPVRVSRSDLATVAIVRGDEGMSVEVRDDAAIARWGRLEVSIDQGGVKDPGTLRALGEAALKASSVQREQHTVGLVMGSTRPMVDYGPGDWVTLDTGTRAVDYRVRSVTLTTDAHGSLTGNAVLNDALSDWEERISKRMSGITGGSTITGGSGSRPAPVSDVKEDATVPNPPTGVLVASNVYHVPNVVVGSDVYATADISWSSPLKNTDGSPCVDLDYFEPRIWSDMDKAFSFDGGMPIPTVGADQTRTFFSPLRANTQYRAQVRAVDVSGHKSEWSAPFTFTTATDTTPPPKPSKPALTARLGTVRVGWDFRDVTGLDMPSDFSHAKVRYTTLVGGKSVTVDAGLLSRVAGELVLVDLPYKTEVRVSLCAVDTTGNESPWSDEAAITLSPLVDNEIVLKTIDAGQTAIVNASNIVLDDGASLAVALQKSSRHAVVSTSAPTAADGSGRSVNDTWTQVNGAGAQVAFWRWDGTSWVSMPLDPVVVPAINVGAGTFGTLDVSRLGATSAKIGAATVDKLWAEVVQSRRISADMILVGNNSDNLITDPYFLDESMNRTRIAAQAGATGSVVVDGGSGKPVLKFTRTDASSETRIRLVGAHVGDWLADIKNEASAIPTVSGEQYRVQVVVWSQGNGSVFLGAETISNGSSLGAVAVSPGVGEFSSVTATAALTQATLTGTINGADGMTFVPFVSMGPGVTDVYLLRAYVARKAGSVLIQDGAVTADKIIAGAVVADKIAANAITSDKIAANAITADKVTAGAITSEAITTAQLVGKNLSGGTITGAWIQTQAEQNRGVKMSSVGLWAYDAAGNLTFYLDAKTGSVTALGTFQSRDAAGKSASLTSQAYDGQAGLQMSSPTISFAGALLNKSSSAQGYLQNDLVLHGPEYQLNSSGRSELKLSPNGDFRLGRLYGASSGFSGLSYDTGTLYLTNQRADGSSDITVQCQQHLTLFTSGGGIRLWPKGDLEVAPGGSTYLKNLPASSSAFHVVIEDNWRIGYSGSTRKIKTEIEDMSLEDVDLAAIKKLRPRTWLDKAQVESGEVAPGDRAHRIPGFIAEEIDEIGGLEPFVLRMDGEIKSVAYDRIPAALVLWLQELEKRVGKLEKKPAEGI